MTPQIAVIVPFYNAADTLPQLIGALRAQTYGGFVALFVNDGSTDGGEAFVEAVSREDARFVLLKGNHGGPGPARNIGLDEADRLGVPYLTFVDADDLPAPDMMETALGEIESSGTDIVHYQWSSEPGGEPHKDSLGGPSIYLWNKLYRRAAIAGIRLIDAKFGEDVTFFAETEARGVRRAGLPLVLYAHVKRGSSLWESRTERDYSAALTLMQKRLGQVAEDPSASDAFIRAWYGFYLPRGLGQWRKLIRRLPRESRPARLDAYIDFVRSIRFPGMTGFRFRMSYFFWSAFFTVKRSWHSTCERLNMHVLRRRYACVKRRIAGNPRQAVRVLFHVTDVSKWKCQSLYDKMASGSAFVPIVFVDLDADERSRPKGDRDTIYRNRRAFFERRGVTIGDGYDVATDRSVSPSYFHADIVFYQQPWKLRPDCRPEAVSRYALTCYVPYYVVNYGMPEIDCQLRFIRCMWTYFVQNEEYAVWYDTLNGRLPRAGRFEPVGHPMLDLVSPSASGASPRKTAIYAPHWTIEAGGRSTLLAIGTFMALGKAVLSYAQNHGEITWVFKPHPLLADMLVSAGGWSASDVRDYYASWERLGAACYDGDYLPLFERSDVLITDSGSFLSEYAVTGKPIVHLVRPAGGTQPEGPVKSLYTTYYRVSDADGLGKRLDSVLIEGEDPNRESRIREAEKTGFLRSDAATAIVQYLDRECGLEDQHG